MKIKIKKLQFWLPIFILMSLLTGCAENNLKAPCPHFGAHCTKTPVNSWNINQ